MQDNDAFRRADSVHEALGWRTRLWVTSYTELEYHVPYLLGERSVAYMRVRDSNPNFSFTAQLLDIYHTAEGDIEQAVIEGADWAEVLVDFLSLKGYGAARIGKRVSTTVPLCRIGEPFPLATFEASLRNTPVVVKQSEFESTKSNDVGRLALRHLRDWLSASLPTVAFASCWNAIECLADAEAEEKGLPRMARCVECKHERIIGWRTKEIIEALYVDAGLDPSLYEQHKILRGKIQHGAKLRTTSFADEVLQGFAQIRTVAISAVSKKNSIIPGTSVSLHSAWPTVIFTCCAGENRETTVQFKKMRVHATAGKLPVGISGEAERTIEIGMRFPPQIEPHALPPIQN